MAGAGQPFMNSSGWESGGLMKNSRVITVMDRQLPISDDGDPPSLYSLCRKWVHNDPELDSLAIPEPVSCPLPPLPAAAPEPEQPAPSFQDEPDNYEAEEALRRLKDHWVAVRHHHQAQASAKLERHRHRLANLIQGGGTQLQQRQKVAAAVAALGMAPPSLPPGMLQQQQQSGPVPVRAPGPQADTVVPGDFDMSFDNNAQM